MTNRTIQFWGQGYSTTVGAELSLTPCTITATIDGTQVFSGTVPTIEGTDIGRLPTDQTVLFTCELPQNVETATYQVALEISGADVYLEQILANYAKITNPVYTPEQVAVLDNPASTQAEKLPIWEAVANPPLSAEEITFLSNNVWPDTTPTLEAHNLELYVSSGPADFRDVVFYSGEADARANVTCTGETYVSPPPPAERQPGQTGTWGWEIEVAPGTTATFSHTLYVGPSL